MASILYISCHEILEFEEISLLAELGHDVFSYQGAYMNPEGNPLLKRPGIGGMEFHADWAEEALKYPKTEIPKDIFDRFDMVIVMHEPEWIIQNWPRMKHKKVVWRTIGQSKPSTERLMKHFRDEGLIVLRYSPLEKNFKDFAGANEMIRFHKKPSDYCGWNGEVKKVINFTQSLKARSIFCHYKVLMELLAGFPSKVYGVGNDDLGGLNGGKLSFDLLKGQLRDNRVFVYVGTWPASYTLSFVEAWMTGIPIVSVGGDIAHNINVGEKFNFFEVPSLIDNGKTGFVSNDIGELRGYIQQLLDDDKLAKKISKAARQKAIEIFGYEQIKQLWKKFIVETLK